MKILSVILARGGSKGIPKKNLSLLGGKPLILHMLEKTLEVSKLYDMKVVLSSDSDEIINISKEAGAWVPFKRPKYLAEDQVESLPVVQHAVKMVEDILNHEFEIIVYVQPNSPFCRVEDFKNCIDNLQNREDLESCIPITEVSTHPFKMKKICENGLLTNFVDQGFEDMRPRQLLPKVFRRAGSIYVSRRDVVMNKNTLVGKSCLGIEVPSITAIDIDNYLDLELARVIYNKFHHNNL